MKRRLSPRESSRVPSLYQLLLSICATFFVLRRAALTLDDDGVGDLVDAKVVPGEAGVVARVSQLDRRDAQHAAVRLDSGLRHGHAHTDVTATEVSLITWSFQIQLRRMKFGTYRPFFGPC